MNKTSEHGATFCTDTLWDWDLTWGDVRDFPAFTECFQNTVLSMFAGGCLWVACPLYILALVRYSTSPLPVSWKYLIKTSVCVLQLSVLYTELSTAVDDQIKQGAGYWRDRVVGTAFQGITLVLVQALLELERRKGFITSGVLSLFWLTSCACQTLVAYSALAKQEFYTTSEGTLMAIWHVGLPLAQCILTCFAETVPDRREKNPCPLSHASFWSRCYFSWMDKFISIGHQRLITDDDVPRLMKTEQSVEAVTNFNSVWDAEKNKLQATTQRQPSQKKPVALMKVLAKVYGGCLLRYNMLKIFDIGLLFSRPIMLGYLIEFAEDLDQPAWKGFVYLLGFVVCLTGDSLLINYLCHLCDSVALRLRSALINAVYSKAMKLTNQSRSERTAGEIVNLVSTDIEELQEWAAYIWRVWSVPVEVVVSCVILYNIVGGAMGGAILVLMLCLPFNTFLFKKMHHHQTKRMDHKDDRIKLMKEILNGMKILKLYAWEMAFGEKVLEIREKELSSLKMNFLCSAFESITWWAAPFLMTLSTVWLYMYMSEEHVLTATVIFSCMSALELLRNSFNELPDMISSFLKAKVSFTRLEQFLNSDEIDPDTVTHLQNENAISLKKCQFTWNKTLGSTLKKISLNVPRGSLVAVVGPVGAGKSSLLSAMLGDIEKDHGSVNVSGSLAYVPQQAWIQHDTLRNNILFGREMKEHTYNDVIESCALTHDLDLLPGKDQTEIGENGINLSGGQKQRVSLARAVYHNADIYLLDDPLSAVDSHVGKHIFDHVIGPDGLLKNKTRVLVTHGMTWLPEVDMVVVMNKGTITECGTYTELMEEDGRFARLVQDLSQDSATSSSGDDESEEADMVDSGVSSNGDIKLKKEKSCGKAYRRSISRAISHDDKQTKTTHSTHEGKPRVHRLLSFDEDTGTSAAAVEDSPDVIEEKMKREMDKADMGKLMEDEEIGTEKINYQHIKSYVEATGTVSCVILLLLPLINRMSVFVQLSYLKDWTSDPELRNLTLLPSDSLERHNKNLQYLTGYAVWGMIQEVLLTSTYKVIMTLAVMKAARQVHTNMLKNVLRCPMSFFDTTPMGRIINRFSYDMESVDEYVAGDFEWFLYSFYTLISVFVAILWAVPMFVVFIIPLAVFYYNIQKLFVPTRRHLHRVQSKKRSPIFSHFSESLTGTSVIRAFHSENRFALESAKRVDSYHEVQFQNLAINRWMNIRLELLTSMCFAGTALFCVLGRESMDGALIGIAINFALTLNDALQGIVRVTSLMQRNVVSLERIGQYCTRDTEAALHTSVRPTGNWPPDGQIVMADYSLRYREGLSLVLKNIHVSVKPGEKIGIVGRTGAGKSSLALGLFRLVEPASGDINIDEQDIRDLGLFDLRSHLTILPQEPVLFSGNLRLNLDPLHAHSEKAIYTALEQAHLKLFIESLPTGLDYEVGEGGQNLSVGQRQLICLARSLLRKTKVLVLDEATAAVDLETDDLIQKTIRTEFQDCTVLTIAHRLNTILDYDRILVLDHGEVKEFESPDVLLENKTSAFYSMAKDAGIIK